ENITPLIQSGARNVSSLPMFHAGIAEMLVAAALDLARSRYARACTTSLDIQCLAALRRILVVAYRHFPHAPVQGVRLTSLGRVIASYTRGLPYVCRGSIGRILEGWPAHFLILPTRLANG